MRIEGHLAVCISLAILASVLLFQQVTCDGEKNFADLYAQTLKLESAELLVNEDSPDRLIEQRPRLLFFFAKEEKSDSCKRQSDHVEGIVKQFTDQAYNWIEDAKTNKGWMTNLLRGGGPLNQLRNLAKAVGPLVPLAERYENQAKKGQLSKVDVDCDMIKVLIKSIHTIMFVLSADVKYMVMEDPRVLNRAIFEKLRSQRLVATKNFYDIVQLNSNQRALLAEFFLNHLDASQINVGMAEDHILGPSEYILGRLLDTCQATEVYREKLQTLESDYHAVCSQSNADPKGHLFETSFPFDKYAETFHFCERFLDSLTPDELA